MKILTGRHGRHTVVFIGLTGAELGGIRNSSMVSTLDRVRGGGLPHADFVSIMRADSEEELRQLALNNGLELDEVQTQPRPGIIMKPTGGDN